MNDEARNGTGSDDLIAPDDLLVGALHLADDEPVERFPSLENYIRAYLCAKKVLEEEEVSAEDREWLHIFVIRWGSTMLLENPASIFPELNDDESNEDEENGEGLSGRTDEEILEKLKEIDPFEEPKGHEIEAKQIRKLCAILSLRHDEEDLYAREDLIATYRIVHNENVEFKLDKRDCKPLEMACMSTLFTTQDYHKAIEMLDNFSARSTNEHEQLTVLWIKAQMLYLEKDYVAALPCFIDLREKGGSRIACNHASECILAIKNEIGEAMTPRDILSLCDPHDFHLRMSQWPRMRDAAYDVPDTRIGEIYKQIAADEDALRIQRAFTYQQELRHVYHKKMLESLKIVKSNVYRSNKQMPFWVSSFIERNGFRSRR